MAAIETGINALQTFMAPTIQRRNQERLMDKQYELNEKAAQNAFNREMQKYRTDYELHTYSAMRKQMEEAGLSVGLMYGGGGSAGVGGGTSGGSAQAQVGLGSASSPIPMPLDPMTVSNLKTAQKQRELIDAQTKKENAQAENLGATTATENESRAVIITGLRENARQAWIANNIEQFNQWLQKEDVFGTSNTNAKWRDDVLGEFEARSESLATAGAVVPVVDQIIKKQGADAASSLMATEEALNNAKTRQTTQQLIIDVMMLKVAQQNADTQAQEAATHRLQATIQKLSMESDVKVNDAQIRQITAAISNNSKLVDFQTGGWGKAGIIIHGAAQLGQLYVGSEMAAAQKAMAVKKMAR